MSKPQRGYQHAYLSEVGRIHRFSGTVQSIILHEGQVVLEQVSRADRHGRRMYFDHTWMALEPFRQALPDLKPGDMLAFSARVIEYTTTYYHRRETYQTRQIGLKDPAQIKRVLP